VIDSRYRPVPYFSRWYDYIILSGDIQGISFTLPAMTD
jgi:hypothetical protein